jgi:hypothetical protein
MIQVRSCWVVLGNPSPLKTLRFVQKSIRQERILEIDCSGYDERILPALVIPEESRPENARTGGIRPRLFVEIRLSFCRRAPQKMPMPDYQSVMLPLLKVAADGKEHHIREAINKLADRFKQWCRSHSR